MRTVLALLVVLSVLTGAARSQPATSPVEAARPVTTSTPGSVEASAPSARTAAAKVTDRVVVIGASISAGFNTSGVAGLPAANLADVLRKMLPTESTVVSYADTLLFQDPETRGARQIARAKRAKPTMIVAVDYPFWWSYGMWLDENDRLKAMERGLALLDAARDAAVKVDGKPVPVLIALLPDTRDLPAGPTVPNVFQVPAKETLTKCNERLRAWAAEREGVIIVPLMEDFERIRGKGTVRVGKAEIDLEKTPAMMQADGLHTTLEGLAFVASRCVESLVKSGVVEEGQIGYEDPIGVVERMRTEGK